MCIMLYTIVKKKKKKKKNYIHVMTILQNANMTC